MAKTPKKIKAVANILAEGDLTKLAHAGTKEAIAKIEAYIKAENDLNKRTYAEIALDECELWYYQSRNEKEERDFILCKIINQHVRLIDDLKFKIERLKSCLEKNIIEQEIHEKVLAEYKKKQKNWQYYFVEDLIGFDKKQLAELTDNVAYEEAWVKAAKKSITTLRYKNGIPERHLSHYDFGFEDCEDEICEDDDCDCCKDNLSRDAIDIEEVPF